MTTELYSELQGYDNWGLDVWVDENDYEYAIALSDDKAYNAATEYIKESLWAFRTSFLVNHLVATENLDDESINDFEELIATYQQTKCEDANSLLLALVGKNLGKLVYNAVMSDGIGHFLASYDSHELDFSDLSEDLQESILSHYRNIATSELRAYRIN